MTPCPLSPNPFQPPKAGHEFIYALVCPSTGKTRYVGRTALSLQLRLNAHYSQSKSANKSNAGLTAWKAQLRSNGERFTIRLLQVVHYASAKSAERKWTRHYQKAGDVLNVRNVLRANTIHGHDLWALNDIADHHRHDTLSIGVATQVGLSQIACFLSGLNAITKNNADRVASYLYSLPANYMARLSVDKCPYEPFFNF